jgi:hypothetical protein
MSLYTQIRLQKDSEILILWSEYSKTIWHTYNGRAGPDQQITENTRALGQVNNKCKILYYSLPVVPLKIWALRVLHRYISGSSDTIAAKGVIGLKQFVFVI